MKWKFFCWCLLPIHCWKVFCLVVCWALVFQGDAIYSSNVGHKPKGLLCASFWCSTLDSLHGYCKYSKSSESHSASNPAGFFKVQTWSAFEHDMEVFRLSQTHIRPRLFQEWIFLAKSGMSFKWKFLAHQSWAKPTSNQHVAIALG